MPLPVLDKEDNQYVFSDWVMYAGQALQGAGYLHTDPTGLYDEHFALAVQAFQMAYGITTEEHQIGPHTWAALGIPDPDAHVDSHVDPHGSAGHAAQTEVLSEDGQWRWDGAQWLPTGQTAPAHHVAAGADHSAHQPGAGPAATDTSHFKDTVLAESIFQYELAILRQWKDALDSFNVVMKSETQHSAKPDFAHALIKVFEDKVLGKFVSETKAGLVFDVLKGVVAEAERAKNAQKSVAFRDFYTTHQTHIANLDKALVTAQPVFVTATEDEADRLIRNDPDSYGMLRMNLMDLYQDANQRLGTATQEALFSDLSAEWVGQAVQGELRIQVLEDDLSVEKVVMQAPDGDKLVEQMTQQPGGMDVWHMHVPKLIIFMNSRKEALGYVRLDAGNNLANLPAEQDGKYHQRFTRLKANGGLAPVTKA
jgi:hypothetical protein